MMAPLQDLLQHSVETGGLGWSANDYGTFTSAYGWFNVFFLMLIFGGMILDKMGVRFTGLMASALMIVGVAIKWYGVTHDFGGASINIIGKDWGYPLLVASFGYAIFGVGIEIAGITVSKIIVRWFKGKEMALAMGLEMAIARLGVFAVMWLSPAISEKFGGSVVAPLAFCTCLLLIGLINYIVFSIMDTRLDKQLIAAGEATAEKSPEDEFHIKDLGKIFSSKMFWLVALLCVLYYSAIFPFQRYAPNFLEVTLNVDANTASRLFSCFPILAMCLTPLLGIFLDHKGKGASMLMAGAVIMIVCHLSFAFLLPVFPYKWFAVLLIVVLGVSFSLVPAALWPSVPKIIDEKILGSAYCLIFWVQNIGLCLVPLLIGVVLNATGGYLLPMIIFSSFGVLAFMLSLLLKVEDKKKGFGLELPNIQDEKDTKGEKDMQ